LPVSPGLGWALVLASLAAVTGVILSLMHLELIGGAVAVAGLFPVAVAVDGILMQGLLLGPCTVTAIVHLLGYSVGPLGQYYWSTLGVTSYVPMGMAMAQWGAFVGLLSYLTLFVIVFEVASRIRLERDRRPPDSQSTWDTFGIMLLALAAAMVAFGYATGATRRIGFPGAAALSPLIVGIATALTPVHQIVFFFLAFSAAKHRSLWRASLWFLSLGLYGLFFSLEGSRGTILTAVMYSSLGLVYGGVSRRAVLAGLALTVALSLPILAVVTEYRAYPTYNASYAQGFGARIKQFIRAGRNYFGGSTSTPGGVMDGYFAGMAAFTVDRVMLLTPETIPYAGFENLERARLIWTPRFINPDKDMILDGNEMSLRYGVGEPDTGTSYYLPTVGEGYRRFGWAGIPLLYALAAVLYGSVAGFAWRRRGRREWAMILLFVTLGAAGAWSSTLLSLAYWAGWVFPKFVICFLALGAIQDWQLHKVSQRFRRSFQ
jgi:hypothetical protein